jgi:hypothetical protein
VLRPVDGAGRWSAGRTGLIFTPLGSALFSGWSGGGCGGVGPCTFVITAHTSIAATFD